MKKKNRLCPGFNNHLNHDQIRPFYIKEFDQKYAKNKFKQLFCRSNLKKKKLYAKLFYKKVTFCKI